MRAGYRQTPAFPAQDGRRLAQLMQLMQGSSPTECWVEKEVEAHMTRGTEWEQCPLHSWTLGVTASDSRDPVLHGM